MTLQVKGLFNGDGVSRGSGGSRETGGRSWTPPPAADNLKKEAVEPAPPPPPRTRETSPVPTGRIAVAPETPISHNLPIFPTQPYPRPFSSSIPSLYPNFPFSRSESSSGGGSSKPTSSAALSFTSTNSGSPTVAHPPSASSSRDYKFSPREREDSFEQPTNNGKPEQLLIGKHRRSSPPPPPASSHRSTSESGVYERPSPRAKLMGESEEAGGVATGSASLRRFEELAAPLQRMKTEGRGEGDRKRTYSGDIAESRETLSRMSNYSTPSTRTETTEGKGRDFY